MTRPAWPSTCAVDADCDDGLWCNGTFCAKKVFFGCAQISNSLFLIGDETCSAGVCQFGTKRKCSDGKSCTDDMCNESNDSCENPPSDCRVSNDPCATDQCIESLGGCQFTCGSILDTWTGISGSSIADLKSGTNNFANTPNRSERLGQLLEAPSHTGDNYGSRMKGWLMPPVTGDYVFWVASDDAGELWLSSNDHPECKVLVCHQLWATWSPRYWTGYPEQKSTYIPLVAGRAYYYEVCVFMIFMLSTLLLSCLISCFVFDFNQALLKEMNGEDYLAIAWEYPGQELEVIPARYSRMTNPYLDLSISPLSMFPALSPSPSSSIH